MRNSQRLPQLHRVYPLQLRFSIALVDYICLLHKNLMILRYELSMRSWLISVSRRMVETYEDLIRLHKAYLEVSDWEIDFASRHCRRILGPLPVVLWRYGFISLNQFEFLLEEYDRISSAHLS